jgi:hypothetical protein
MNKLLVLSLLIILIISSACSKDDPEPTPAPPTNYQPITKGSYWTYSGYNGGQSFNTEINGLTDTIIGMQWYGFNHTLLGASWFRKEYGVYYNLYSIGGNMVEFPYLKDDKAVGHTWETQINLAGVTTKLMYSIIEKDVSKVVFGQLYKNVIVVQMETDYDLGGGFGTIDATGEYWYANDIGLIYSDISDEGLTYLDIYKIN